MFFTILLVCLSVCFVAITALVDLYHNPLHHPSALIKRRTLMWVLQGFGYSFEVMGRYNLYALNVRHVRVSLGASKAQYGGILTAGAWAYGVGMLVNGPIVEIIGGRRAFLLSQSLSFAVNLALALTAQGLDTGFSQENASSSSSSSSSSSEVDSDKAGKMRAVATVFYMLVCYMQTFGLIASLRVNYNWFAKSELGRYSAVFGVMVSCGYMFALAGSGYVLRSNLPWYYIYYATAAGCFLFFFVSLFVVRNTPESAGLRGLQHRYNPVDAQFNGLDDKTMMHWTEIFRVHKAWWLVLCMVCFGLVREGFLAWSIPYIEEELHSTPGDRTHTIMSMAISGGSVAGTILVGYMADFAFHRNRFAIPLTFNVLLLVLFVTLYYVKTLWTSVSIVFGCATCLFALQGYRRILSMDMGATHTVAIFTGVLAASQFAGGGVAGVTFGWLIDYSGYQAWLTSLMVLSVIYAIVSGLYWRLKALRLTGRVGNPLGL